jgi:bifunctional non-homologous end joining protein LigD
VHEVCEEWQVPAFPKTTGKTGIHIFIPMAAKYTYEQARQFTLLIVTEVNKRLPSITSLERSPKERQGKVYLDYLQNSRGQTLATAYSVRPTKEATVSAPLYWKEVNENLKPTDFTIKNMPARLKKVGDLWRGVIGRGVDIAKVIKQIEKINSDRT